MSNFHLRKDPLTHIRDCSFSFTFPGLLFAKFYKVWFVECALEHHQLLEVLQVLYATNILLLGTLLGNQMPRYFQVVYWTIGIRGLV